MGSVNMGLPVSQHLPGVVPWGPEAVLAGGGPPLLWEAGLTEATADGLPPGGRTTALVTAILRGWWADGWCGGGCELLEDDALSIGVGLRTEVDDEDAAPAGDDEVALLTVTGH